MSYQIRLTAVDQPQKRFCETNFDEHLFADGLYQSLFIYWQALFATRGRQVGSPIDDEQPATGPTASGPLAALQDGGR